MKSVPLFEAKNRFSELVAAAERGDEVAITRRGVAVARLVAMGNKIETETDRRTAVRATFDSLKAIREHLVLDGDLKSIAREGLD